MSKFKVGDRIRYNSATPDTGTVTSIKGKQVWAKWDRDGSTAFLYSDSPKLQLLSYPETAHPVGPLPHRPALPTDSDKRKEYPLYSGLMAYFPAALAQVSNHSYLGNQKHNPGKPLQHARGVSGDHADCILRHLVDSAEHPKGSPARIDELRALAWRSLALLQEELELTGVVPAPAATFDRAS